MPLFRSFEATGATGAVNIRVRATRASAVGRPFGAVALVLGLLLGASLPLGFLFSVSAPVAAGREFRPSMRVPVGVDADGDRVDDRLDSEIAQRVLNRLALAVC